MLSEGKLLAVPVVRDETETYVCGWGLLVEIPEKTTDSMVFANSFAERVPFGAYHSVIELIMPKIRRPTVAGSNDGATSPLSCASRSIVTNVGV